MDDKRTFIVKYRTTDGGIIHTTEELGYTHKDVKRLVQLSYGIKSRYIVSCKLSNGGKQNV